MKPLVYLTVRSLLNGIRRALTSGRRLIGLVFVICYYFFFFVRPFDRDTGGTENLVLPKTMIPAAAQVEAVAFAALAIMSLMLSMGMFTARGGFKPADVDVLFATPVKPGTVLLFRMARDYLSTLLLPLVFLILGWRGTTAGVQAFAAQYPTLAPQVMRSGFLAYLLMALAWVFLTTAIGLYLNRSDEVADRNRKVFGWGYFLAVAGLMAYCVLTMRSNPTFDGFVALAQSWPLRLFAFPATLAAAIVNGAIENSAVWLAAGIGSLGLLMVVGYKMAMREVSWLYDQAAAQAFKVAATVDLQKKGDFMGVIAEQARQGKVKGKGNRWYHRIKVQGGPALVWKELILQLRSTLYLNLLFALFVVGMPFTAILINERPGREGLVGNLFLGLSALGVFIFSMATAQTGFAEILKRVDLQKPLPFTPAVVVLWELVAKSSVAMVPILISCSAAAIVRPSIAGHALGALILLPTFALMIYSTTFLTTILFPDVDDPTQRSFRGLMQLLGIAIVGAPGLGLFIGLLALDKLTGFPVHPALAALPAAAVNLGLVGLLGILSGRLYASYNPSE